MGKFAVILAAAGRSSRFGDAFRKKPFVDLAGKAVWLRAVEPFAAHPDVVQIVIVVSPDDMDWFKEKFRPNLAFMDIQVIAGGNERADSVQNALDVIRSEIDLVAVHDAARPLITKDCVGQVFKEAIKSGAAIPAAPITGTIKRVKENSIKETVSREGLWEAQTPQVFQKELLLKAYAERDGFIATDEAQLVERLGHSVSVVECSSVNIKITTQQDLKLAGALLNANSEVSRTLKVSGKNLSDL